MTEQNNMADTQSLYRPLKFRPVRQNAALAREAAAEWLNFYAKTNRTVGQWRKLKDIALSWQTPNLQSGTVKFRFDQLVSNIIQDTGFVPERLGIPQGTLLTPWADRSIQMSVDHFRINPEDTTKTSSYRVQADICGHFPVWAGVDREGIAFAPLHAFLYQALLNARNHLVNQSENMLTFDANWLQNFFSYFNSSVSIIESTLVQIHYKAKYDPAEAGLTFDAEKMGSTITGRVVQKFDWIRYATGQPLDGVARELTAFNRLRAIRNHINHFDPPSFSCTAEDLCGWLNLTAQLGSLLWAIRRKLRLPPSKAVLALSFAPEVEFVPKDPIMKRLPQPPDVGYGSCILNNAINS